MLQVVVHPANVQDRDGAARVLDKRTRRRFPFIEVVFADQGYQGPAAATAIAKTGKWTLVWWPRSLLSYFLMRDSLRYDEREDQA